MGLFRVDAIGDGAGVAMSADRNNKATRAHDMGCVSRRQRAKREAQRQMVMALPRPRDEDDRLLLRILMMMTREPRPKPVPPKHQRERCGAKCRDGHACRAPVFKRPDGSLARRCRMHGGASTGPKTEEGKRRALEALHAGLLRRWEKYRLAGRRTGS